MRKYTYYLLDVFTTQQFGGNPLAVFTDTTGLKEAEYQKLAAELNLSETVFIETANDPEAIRRLRIFTPRAELPLAGHPVVGSWNLLVSQGLVNLDKAVSDELAQVEKLGELKKYSFKHETKAGVFPMTLIRSKDAVDSVIMDQGLPKFGKEVEDKALVARTLNLEENDLLEGHRPRVVNTSIPVMIVPLASRDALARAKTDIQAYEELAKHDEMVGIYVFCMKGGGVEESALVSSRGFFPLLGIIEDAATGSASGCLGSYLVHSGLVECKKSVAFRNEQGIDMGRPSQINIEISKKAGQISRVRVGGSSVLMGRGEIWLD